MRFYNKITTLINQSIDRKKNKSTMPNSFCSILRNLFSKLDSAKNTISKM